MNCSNCNKELKANAKFCKYCGAKTENYVEKTKSEKPKDELIKSILLIVSSFLAISQGVFLIMFFTLGGKLDKTKTTKKEEVVKENTTLNYNNMKLSLDDIDYEVYNGKIILNKESSWNVIAAPILISHNAALENADIQKERLIGYDYEIINQNIEEKENKNVLIFTIKKQDRNGFIVYYPLENDKTLFIEIYIQGDKSGEEVLNEVLEIFSSATTYKEPTTIKENQMIYNTILR